MALRIHQSARCKRCNYPLRGLVMTRCPECGGGFDPLDPLTYRVPGGLRRLGYRRVRDLVRRLSQRPDRDDYVITLVLAALVLWHGARLDVHPGLREYDTLDSMLTIALYALAVNGAVCIYHLLRVVSLDGVTEAGDCPRIARLLVRALFAWMLLAAVSFGAVAVSQTGALRSARFYLSGAAFTDPQVALQRAREHDALALIQTRGGWQYPNGVVFIRTSDDATPRTYGLLYTPKGVERPKWVCLLWTLDARWAYVMID